MNCNVCNAPVVFDQTAGTKYWKSTFDEPEVSLFIVQRSIPNVNSKGKVTYRITNEHVLALYCGPECGLKDYGNASFKRD